MASKGQRDLWETFVVDSVLFCGCTLGEGGKPIDFASVGFFTHPPLLLNGSSPVAMREM